MDKPVNPTIGERDVMSVASFLAPRAIAVIGAAPAEQRSIRGMLLAAGAIGLMFVKGGDPRET